MAEDNFSDVPSTPISSTVIEAAKLGIATLSAVGAIATSNPGVGIAGAAVAETFGALMVPIVSKRGNSWLKRIGKGIDDLQKFRSDITRERLEEKESFWSTVMYASQIAMHTHQEEKLEALKNAVLNAALPNSPDDDLQLIYLNFVDILTVCEMRLLTFYIEPQKFGVGPRIPNSPPGTARKTALELVICLEGKEYLYEHYMSDLVNRGLLEWGKGPASRVSGDYTVLYVPESTSIGSGFYEFIRDPMKK